MLLSLEQDAVGVLTLRGGVSSHAAVTMRSMGKAAVTNAQGITLAHHQDELSSSMQGVCLHQGDSITIDGSTGTVYMGGMPTIAAGRDEYFQTIMQWADKYKRMQVLSLIHI